MTHTCKRRRLPAGTVGRLRKILLRAALLSIPTFAVNLLVQGRKEFKPELETRKKYNYFMKQLRKDDKHGIQ